MAKGHVTHSRIIEILKFLQRPPNRRSVLQAKKHRKQAICLISICLFPSQGQSSLIIIGLQHLRDCIMEVQCMSVSRVFIKFSRNIQGKKSRVDSPSEQFREIDVSTCIIHSHISSTKDLAWRITMRIEKKHHSGSLLA